VQQTALLVIDMLNDFVLEGAPLEVPATRTIIPLLQDEIEKARRNHIPLIYVCDAHEENDPEFVRMGWPPHALSGTRGAEVIDSLQPLPHDTIIPKKSYSAFFSTSLDMVLQTRSITELLITGCVTNICVLYTVADAVQRGYRVTILRNCVAGLNEVDHEFALRQMKEVLGTQIL
jgi:nicotinamidase-related amidase